MRAHFLKGIGHARWSLPDAWLAEPDGAARLARTGFPRRPRMTAGDRLVYYAAGWKAVFAVVEVLGDPYAGGTNPRWPWVVDVEPLLAIPRMDAAPPVEAIGVAARSMSQQSHIRISPEQYERAVQVLASVAL